tara:strand:+ start:181 stop:384 length:204 start_codon:yes stop_codon:yes gene_type:complete
MIDRWLTLTRRERVGIVIVGLLAAGVFSEPLGLELSDEMRYFCMGMAVLVYLLSLLEIYLPPNDSDK